MKKLAFVFGALLMGFMFTSCGNAPKAKDGMINDVDAYFTKAEQELAAIDNTEDFIAFAVSMNDRSDILNELDEKYGDKKITDEDWEVVEKFIYDRATAYNTAEGEKCTEFLAPAIDRYEAIVNKLYDQYEAGIAFADADLDEYLDAAVVIDDFSECENVDPDLVDRLSPIFDKEDVIFDLIMEGLDRMYPTED